MGVCGAGERLAKGRAAVVGGVRQFVRADAAVVAAQWNAEDDDVDALNDIAGDDVSWDSPAPTVRAEALQDGDWVVRLFSGELLVMKNRQFLETYEPAELVRW